MSDMIKYAVLIDAGSSGSRVFVYQWIANEQAMEQTKIEPVPGYVKKQTGPGIATLAPEIPTVKAADLDTPVHISEQMQQSATGTISTETLTRVKKYLDPLLDHARNFVPLLEIKKTPLFILATGGMRRLELAQHQAYQVLCDAITTYLSTMPFKEPTFATISGEDEALYGWVAANFVDGSFIKKKNAQGIKETTPHGFMELGGESAQFAVSLKRGEDHGKYDGPLCLVDIWGISYDVYLKTWMGIGNDSAWKRHLEKLRASDSAMPLDPCLPKGYSYRLSGSDKIVVGTGDFVACMKEALSLLACPNPLCRDGELCIYRPNVDGVSDCPASVGCLLRDAKTGYPLLKFDKEKFSGASVYWHATHGIFRASNKNEKEDFQTFWDTVVRYSKLDWETLKADRPRERATDYKFLRRGFFTAALVMSTLFLGFGVPMPPQAVEAARSFATERTKYAKMAAENAEEDARDGTRVADAALDRKVKAVETAEAKVLAAEEAKSQAEEARGSVCQEQVKLEIQELKEILLAVRNEPNREDYMDAVQNPVAKAGDYHDHCKEQAREARGERKQATDKAKQAYDKLLDAKRKHTRVARTVKRVTNGDNVDKTLVEMYEKQEENNKYASLKDADWPIGRIVLHVSGCTPKTVTKEGWLGVASR